eukprot:7002083-Prymnesium_polylepis.1
MHSEGTTDTSVASEDPSVAPPDRRAWRRRRGEGVLLPPAEGIVAARGGSDVANAVPVYYLKRVVGFGSRLRANENDSDK